MPRGFRLVYVIIGLVLLVVIMPLIAVLPSARQKEQMKMRDAARAAGVSVELTSIDDPNPNQDKYITQTGRAMQPVLKVVAYRLQRKPAGDWRRTTAIPWCLKKNSDGGWQWSHERNPAMSDELYYWLLGAVEDLPEDVEQVEESGDNLAVYWHERNPGSEAEVIEFLKHCASLPLHKPVAEDEQT